MGIALSTRFFGTSSFSADGLLAAMQKLDLRECFLAASTTGPSVTTVAKKLREEGARAIAVELGFLSDGMLVASDADPPALSSGNLDEKTAALALLKGSAERARIAGISQVVFRLGRLGGVAEREREQELRSALLTTGVTDHARDQAAELRDLARHEVEPRLDDICRLLFSLCRSEPDIRFAICPPDSPLCAPSLELLSMLFDEVKEKNIGYWHDSRVAHEQECLGLVQDDAWAGENGPRLMGAFLSDVAGSESHLPPGSGEVDFRHLRDLLPSRVPVVLDVADHFPIREVSLALSLLQSMGY